MPKPLPLSELVHAGEWSTADLAAWLQVHPDTVRERLVNRDGERADGHDVQEGGTYVQWWEGILIPAHRWIDGTARFIPDEVKAVFRAKYGDPAPHLAS